MPGIALKYWAFDQTGWGHVDETVIPPIVIPPNIPVGRSDGDDWKWIGVPQPLGEPQKPLIHRIEKPILTVLQFYTYSTEKYELNFRAQEKLGFASEDGSFVLCENISPSLSGKKLQDYLSIAVNAPSQKSVGSIFNYENLSISIPNQKERIFLQWQSSQYGEALATSSLPLSVFVNLKERLEYQTKSTTSIPWHIRTSIVEYIRWQAALSMSFPADMDDETLLATLAHIIVNLKD